MTPAQQQAARIEKDVEAAALGRELMMPMPPDWFETEWRTYKGWACTAVSKDHYSKPFAERNNYSQLAEAATRQEAHRLCREQAWAKHRKNTGEV